MDGSADVGALYYDVDNGAEDPPVRLLNAAADMIVQGVAPFGPGAALDAAAPQIPCLLAPGRAVRWQGATWKVAGRTWRGHWLLSLERDRRVIDDMPAHLVEHVESPPPAPGGGQVRLS